jgi:putative tryptophan/tyrosine transport system substrate-binding protein
MHGDVEPDLRYVAGCCVSHALHNVGLPVGQWGAFFGWRMNRREFTTLSGWATVATVWATGGIAQRSEPPRRIGALFSGGFGQSGAPVFSELEKLGWVKGRNIHFEERLHQNETVLMRTLAAELVKLSPDVILASSPIEAKALQLETGTVPIVFVIGVDPVSQGVVDSIARPGHNVTGCSSFDFSMGGKWAQTLKEIAPHTKQMGIIFNPQTAPYMPSIVQSVESGAGPLQIKITAIPVLDDAELGQAITSLAHQSDSAMVVPPDIFLSARMQAIVALAAQLRLPAIYPGAPIAKLGGLLAYGPDFSDNYRRAAKLIDRILNGAKPADLPVEQPDKFQMAINLKTAKLLGLTVPPTLLAQADEVIE